MHGEIPYTGAFAEPNLTAEANGRDMNAVHFLIEQVQHCKFQYSPRP